jgi:hypothetical protein
MSDENTISCTREALSGMLAAARDEAVSAALAPVASKQPTGYYSTVRFQGTNSGVAPAFLYTVLAGDRKAFNYTVGASMETAGFAPGVLATLRHTNLSKAGETRAGETYYVQGVSYHIAPFDNGSGSAGALELNDPILAFAIWSNAFAQLSMNGGTDSWPLGPLFFFPAIAGLSGAGSSRIVPPDLQSTIALVANIQNGQQEADNYFEFKDPIIWTSSGNTDSQLQWVFTLPKDLVFGTDARVAGAGVTAYTPPAGIALDVTVRLIGHSISKLSVNR